jgi:hypothetical protein
MKASLIFEPIIKLVLGASDGRADSNILHCFVHECRLEFIILDKWFSGLKS